MIDPKNMTALVPCGHCAGRACLASSRGLRRQCPECEGAGTLPAVLLQPEVARLSAAGDLRLLLVRFHEEIAALREREAVALAGGRFLWEMLLGHQRAGLAAGAGALEYILTATPPRLPARRTRHLVGGF